jgi:hypothetical protein
VKERSAQVSTNSQALNLELLDPHPLTLNPNPNPELKTETQNRNRNPKSEPLKHKPYSQKPKPNFKPLQP